MAANPITTEVLRNALYTLAEEMQVTLVKTALSIIVKETGDCSCALHDARGNQISQASALPMHLGILTTAVKAILEKYGASEMNEGDIYIMNGPYRGASHLNDIVIALPIFFEGHLVSIAANIAHHQDVGGMTPGSMPGNATELFQEGINIPISKLYAADIVNETLIEMLKANVRLPGVLWGDIEAQLAAVKIGGRGFINLVKKYGAKTVMESMDGLLHYSELRTQNEIETITNGIYEGVAFLDNDGITFEQPVRLHVKVTVDDRSLTFDLSKTDKQVKGPVNMDYASTRSSVAYAMAGIMPEDIPHNDGAIAPYKIIAPKGCLLNPNFPAAVNARSHTSGALAMAILNALSQAVPDKVMAGTGLGPGILLVGGVDNQTGKYFTLVEGNGPGAGARANIDGISGKDVFCSNTLGTPVEAEEMDYPVMIERYELIKDSGGAGKFRGGLGVRRDLRLLTDEAVLTMQSDNLINAPDGLFGGSKGMNGSHILLKEKEKISMPGKCGEIRIQAGDLVIRNTAGGGGYGNPLERDPELIYEDVINEKISIESARNTYGVVIQEGNLQVDLAATKLLRNKKAAKSMASQSQAPELSIQK